MDLHTVRPFDRLRANGEGIVPFVLSSSKHSWKQAWGMDLHAVRPFDRLRVNGEGIIPFVLSPSKHSWQWAEGMKLHGVRPLDPSTSSGQASSEPVPYLIRGRTAFAALGCLSAVELVPHSV